MLDLEYCRNLVSMPDLSGLEQLKSVAGIEHLKPWKDGGYKAFSFASWPEAQIDQGAGLKALQLTQGYWVFLKTLPDLSECVSPKALDLKDCYGLTTLPELRKCVAL
eukprot:4686836-Prymnesium_polylepis.2